MAAPKNVALRVILLLQDGVTRSEIAKSLGVSKGTVTWHARRNGLPMKRQAPKRPAVMCKNCGHKLKGSTRFFCTRSCHKAFMGSNRYARFLAGELDVYLTSRSLRGALVKRDGEKCSVCDLDKWMNVEIPLEIDHIDGNSGNGKSENVRLICPNCHALTPTYKGRNAGNGRHKRRQRYQDGKSY
jgi:transposase